VRQRKEFGDTKAAVVIFPLAASQGDEEGSRKEAPEEDCEGFRTGCTPFNKMTLCKVRKALVLGAHWAYDKRAGRAAIVALVIAMLSIDFSLWTGN
jgi:hypothetical protein